MTIPSDSGSGRATTHSAHNPSSTRRTGTADRLERDAVPARARSGPASASEPLRAAAQRTDDALRRAQTTRDTVRSLAQMPPQRQRALQGEISQARADAAQADQAARDAVRSEVTLARQALTPAQADRYVEDLQLAHHTQPDQADLIDAAVAAQGANAAPARQPTPLEQKLDAAKRAEQEYLALVSQGAPSAAYQQYVIEPKRQAVEARWQEVQTAVEQELTSARVPPGLPFSYDPVVARAGQLAASDDHPRFQQIVSATQTKVVDQRLAQAGAAEVARAYEQGGAPAAASALANLTQSFTPPQAAQLVRHAASTIDQITSDLSTGPPGQDTVDATLTDLARAARHGGPEAAARIGQSLARVYDPQDSVLPAVSQVLSEGLQSSVTSGAGAELAVATANALQASGNVSGAAMVDRALVEGIDGLRESNDEAQKQYVQKELELQQDLLEFGPAMTNDEKAKYAEAFWSDTTRPSDELHEGDLSHAEIRARADRSGDQLARALEVAGPRLEQQALAGDSQAAQALLEGHEALARSAEHAEQSVRWMTHIGNDDALFGKIDEATDGTLVDRLRDGISTDGVNGMAADLAAKMATAPDETTAERYYQHFKDVLGGVGKAKQLASFDDDVGKMLEQLDQVRDGIKHLKDDQLGDWARKRYERQVRNAGVEMLEGWADKNGFQKALAGAGLAVGFIDAGKAFHDGEVFNGILESAGVAKDLTEVGIGVLKVWGDAGKLSSGAADFATQASKIGGKYLPFVGLTLDLIQARGDIAELSKNPNVGEALAGIGTVVSLVGDIPETVPILGTAVGGVLGTIGMAISGVGGFIDNLIEGDQAKNALEARQRKYFAAAGLDESTTQLLMGDKEVIAMLDNFNLEPPALRSLIRDVRAADPAHQEVAGHLMTIAASFGFEGPRADAFIRSGLAVSNPQDVLESTHLPDPSASPYASVDQMQYLTNLSEEPSVQSTRAEVTNELRQSQLQWLRTELPDVYEQAFANVYTPQGYSPFGEVNLGYFADRLALHWNSGPIAGKSEQP
jgi:hypothetical protein